MRIITYLLLLFGVIFSSATAQIKHLPSKITLNYQGPYNLPVTMTFSQENSAYEIRTQVKIPFNPINFVTQGKIEKELLKPNSYQDYRKNKIYAHARFDYQTHHVYYGQKQLNKQATMQGLSQDLFSLAWQMSINKGLISQKIQITNGKKVYIKSPFVKIGTKKITINRKPSSIEVYKSGEGDDYVEFGLALEHYYLPALILFYDKGKRYELLLTQYSFPQ